MGHLKRNFAMALAPLLDDPVPPAPSPSNAAQRNENTYNAIELETVEARSGFRTWLA